MDIASHNRDGHPPESAAAPTTAATRRVYSVSELTARIKSLLEERFPFVWIQGEISNLRIPGSGHCYFTLKDEKAQIAAVMFRSQGRQLKFTPEDGMSVIGFGRVTVYEPRGSYQIILEYLEPAGIGALQLAFEQLRQRLAAAGYFDAERKRRLPLLPRKIAVVTSPTGAVVRDIITVATRRNPRVQLMIVPVRVQGAEAEGEIVSAIELLNRRADADVMILARGGGSLEDLQAFNSERVAVAIFNSQIPVVSAVGHETDFTIADFVADLRAPTPSAAAEMVVPDYQYLQRSITSLTDGMVSSIRRHVVRCRERLFALRQRLVDPRRRIQMAWMRLDDLNGRLTRRIAERIERERERVAMLTLRLSARTPEKLIAQNKEKLAIAVKNINQYIKLKITSNRYQLQSIISKLEALSPMAVLRRGYSITRTVPEGRVVCDSEGVEPDQRVEVLLSRGALLCRVEERRSPRRPDGEEEL